VSSLYQLVRLLAVIYLTYRGWQSRRQWDAGRPMRIQAEIDRSNRYIAATFPTRDGDASNDLTVDKESP
jgi:hypothetical protein